MKYDVGLYNTDVYDVVADGFIDESSGVTIFVGSVTFGGGAFGMGAFGVGGGELVVVTSPVFVLEIPTTPTYS